MMYCVVLHFENNWYKAVIFHTNNVISLTLQDIDDPIGLHFFKSSTKFLSVFNRFVYKKDTLQF